MTVKMTDYTHEETAVNPHCYMVADDCGEGYRHVIYVIVTQHGTVTAIAYNDRQYEFTSLSFVLHGREYRRRWERVWDRRTVTRLAREMVQEIVNE